MNFVIDKNYEKLYTPSKWSKKFPDSKSVLNNFIKVCTSSNKELVNQVKTSKNVSYGESEKQKIDIYYPQHSTANERVTVVTIIHGGYWQEGDKELCAFMSKYLLEAGYTTVFIGYDLTPSITLQGIIDEIDTGVNYISKSFPKSNIVLMGHSAEAYLTVSAACNKNLNIKGIIPISGVFDLRPPVKTSMNNAIQLTEAEATRLCLHRDLPVPSSMKVLILVGEDESAAFIKQSEDLFLEMKTKTENVEIKILKGEDHFSIIENFYVKDHPVVQEVLSFLLELESEK